MRLQVNRALTGLNCGVVQLDWYGFGVAIASGCAWVRCSILASHCLASLRQHIRSIVLVRDCVPRCSKGAYCFTTGGGLRHLSINSLRNHFAYAPAWFERLQCASLFSSTSASNVYSLPALRCIALSGFPISIFQSVASGESSIAPVAAYSAFVPAFQFRLSFRTPVVSATFEKLLRVFLALGGALLYRPRPRDRTVSGTVSFEPFA